MNKQIHPQQNLISSISTEHKTFQKVNSFSLDRIFFFSRPNFMSDDGHNCFTRRETQLIESDYYILIG